MCSITAIPVMCSTPAQSTPSLLKELYHHLSPAYLREDILLSDNSNHQTRSVTSPSCQIPRVNSSGLKSFFFTAIKCWNSLPSCVRNIDLKQPFKSMLKKTIWDQMFLENQQSFIYY